MAPSVLKVVMVPALRTRPLLSVFLGIHLAGCVGPSVAWHAQRPSSVPVAVRESQPSPALDLVPVADTASQASRQEQAADASPPTWGSIYARYLGPGTDAGCARARCHANVMPDADAAYQWLTDRGYIQGEQSALVRSNSCLQWFGGNMPPMGAPSESARRDLIAWAAAGARNN